MDTRMNKWTDYWKGENFIPLDIIGGRIVSHGSQKFSAAKLTNNNWRQEIIATKQMYTYLFPIAFYLLSQQKQLILHVY